MSDPLTEPLEPRQEPYHLRADATVEARQLAQLRALEQLTRAHAAAARDSAPLEPQPRSQ